MPRCAYSSYLFVSVSPTSSITDIHPQVSISLTSRGRVFSISRAVTITQELLKDIERLKAQKSLSYYRLKIRA